MKPRSFLLGALLTLVGPLPAEEPAADPVARMEAVDPLVRYRALRALEPGGPARAAALRALGDREGFVRLEAGRTLLRLGARKADIPVLVGRLDNADAAVAQLIGEVLATLGPDAAEALHDAYDEADKQTRRRILSALHLLGPDAASALPLVVPLTVAKDPAARRQAQEIVRRVGPFALEYAPELIDLARFAPEQRVRWAALSVLGSFGPAAQDAVEPLKAIAADDEEPEQIRQAAARALATIDVRPLPERHPALDEPKLADRKAPPRFTVKFETTKGDVVVAVERAWAPHAADRFYSLVKIGFFDDVAFFRVLDGFVAQFGLHGDSRVNAVWADRGMPPDPRKLSNERGTLVFAQTADPRSRATQLFFNLQDNGDLDAQGFAPFGKVVSGMKALDALYAGYGEAAPAGQGPQQRSIKTLGAEYLKRQFPKLDRVRTARVVKQTDDKEDDSK